MALPPMGDSKVMSLVNTSKNKLGPDGMKIDEANKVV
jgi:hypothetical protein